MPAIAAGSRLYFLPVAQVQSGPHPHDSPQPQNWVLAFILVFIGNLLCCVTDVMSAFIPITHGRPGHYRRPQAHIYIGVVAQPEPLSDDTLDPLPVLVDNHRAFLRYLERRVGDRALAEDILQDAFVKVMDRPELAPAGESVVPWFYRTLRNAAIDRFRRQGAAARAIEAFARELETQAEPAPDMEAEICACITRLASTLKAEYAEALDAIDVQGTPVKVFAEQRGLSANNAGVRVFRAREALKKRLIESCGTCAEHGCRNCTCQTC